MNRRRFVYCAATGLMVPAALKASVPVPLSFFKPATATASSPVPTASLASWLKADAITGHNDGDSMVTTDWPDSSGNGRSSLVFSGVTYKTNVQNALPVCRFAGAAGNGMTFANSANLLLSLPYTIFIVYSYRGTVSAGHRAFQGSSNWLIGPYSNKYSFYNGAFIDGPSTTQNLFKY